MFLLQNADTFPQLMSVELLWANDADKSLFLLEATAAWGSLWSMMHLDKPKGLLYCININSYSMGHQLKLYDHLYLFLLQKCKQVNVKLYHPGNFCKADRRLSMLLTGAHC